MGDETKGSEVMLLEKDQEWVLEKLRQLESEFAQAVKKRDARIAKLESRLEQLEKRLAEPDDGEEEEDRKDEVRPVPEFMRAMGS